MAPRQNVRQRLTFWGLFVAHGFGGGDAGGEPGGEEEREVGDDEYAGVQEGESPPVEFDGHEVDVVGVGVEGDDVPSVLDEEECEHEGVADHHARERHSHRHVDEYHPHSALAGAESPEQTYETLFVEDDYKHAADERDACHDGHEDKYHRHIGVEQGEPAEISGALVDGIVDAVETIDRAVGKSLEQPVVEVFGICADVAEIVGVDHDARALRLADFSKVLNQREVTEKIKVIVIVEMGIIDGGDLEPADPQLVAHKICVDLVAHLQPELTGGGARHDDFQLVGIIRIIGNLTLLERGSEESTLPGVGKAAHVYALEIVAGLEDRRDRCLKGIVGNVRQRVE